MILEKEIEVTTNMKEIQDMKEFLKEIENKRKKILEEANKDAINFFAQAKNGKIHTMFLKNDASIEKISSEINPNSDFWIDWD